MKSCLGKLLAFVIVMAAGVSFADAKEYLVGVHLPLTGPMALAGIGTLEGITTAVDVFNRKNPKTTIKLVTIDDEGAAAKAVSAVEKLASQAVVGITGGYPTNLVGVASDAANKAKLPYITSGGTADSLSARGLRYFFKISDTYAYANAVVGVISQMGAKSVSMLYSTKEGTTEMAQHVQKGLAGKGIKVMLHPYESSTTDFKPIVNKVKLQDRPDVIYMGSYENEYIGILRAANVLKPEVKAIVGMTGLATAKMLATFPELLNNVFAPIMIPVPAEFRTAEGKEFAETYRRLYRKDPNFFMAQIGFVQAQILFQAIKSAEQKGTLAKGGLADELRRTSLKDSLIGPVAFNEAGKNTRYTMRFGQFQNGKIAVVWPKDYANGKISYPALPW